MPAGKKTTPKQTIAKKPTVKKTPAKKPTAKKAPAKVSATKKPTVKGTTAKNTTAKKTTVKKATAKKPPAKVVATKKPTVKKTTEKAKPDVAIPKIDVNNINLLPLMIRIGISGFPLETTYFNTDMCRKGLYYLVHSNGKYFLLLPKWNERQLKEMETGQTVIITRGKHEGKKDYFEIIFNDNTENPYAVLLSDEQFTRITPLKEGWNGKIYVYSGDLDECKLIFPYVYYRVTDNLPCFDPIKEEIGKLHGLTALSHVEAIAALKAGERLVNGKDNYDVAHYHLYNNEILKSDSYYDLNGEGEKIPEDKLPQLYRMGDGMFASITDHVRAILKPLLDSDEFPLLKKRMGLEKLTNQLVTHCVVSSKATKVVSKINFEIILTQLEKSLR